MGWSPLGKRTMSRAAYLLLLCASMLAPVTQLFAADPPAVSADLQAIYARTSTATQEAEFTAIAKECSLIIPDAKRSEGDKAYASKLFAWALNRRGEVRSETAASFVKEGKLSEAQQLDQLAGKDFATAAKYAPDNWRVHHNLAISHAMQGKYDEAIEQLSIVIQLKDDYPNAFYNRAELYFEKEQFPQAIKDYSRAIELVDNDARYFNGRAHARFMLNSTEEAIADYTQAATLETTSPAYVTDLADALQSAGRWEAAAERYRQAVKIDKSYARAYRNIAWLLATCPDRRFRNPNLALTAARKAIELSGDQDYRALDTLAAATAATGNPTEATQLMTSAMAIAPPGARSELAARSAVYSKGGKYVQAAPKIERTVPDVTRSEVRTASAEAPAKR